MTLSRKLAHLITEKGATIDDVTESLRTYNLLSLLPSILKDVRHMNRGESMQNTILIETPFEMNDEALARIKRIVGNDLAPHQVTINKELLAGFKARFKGMVYDGSAERVLRQFINN